MTVTQMVAVTKTRTRVVIDDDQTLVLSNKEIDQYGLVEGGEIHPSSWEELCTDLRRQALLKCGKLLMGMDYSRKGLTDKLVRSGFPEDVAAESAGEMEQAGYVNDRKLAENYLKYHLQDRSLARIRQDLYQKGVPKQITEEVILHFSMEDPDFVEENERAQIRRLLEKRHFDPDTGDYAQIQKTVAYLIQKGYQPADIRAVLKELDSSL